MSHAYISVLRGRAWRRPLTASLIGRIPESMISVALVLLVHQNTGSYLAAGLVTAGFALGSAFAGPGAGRALDRLGQRPVLIALGVAFAAMLVALVLLARHVPIVATVALAGLAGLSRPPLESAMRALWATIVSAGQLQTAYVLDAIGQDLIWLAGPLLLSVLLLIAGPDSALLACAACTALGSLAYATTPQVPRHHGGKWGAVRPARLHSAATSSLLGAAALYGVAMGAFEIALTAFCAERGAQPAVGLLLAVWSVGSIVGGLAYGARNWATPPLRRASALLGALAILLALLNLAEDVPTLAVLLFAMGLPTAPFTGTLSAAMQALAPGECNNEGFTWVTAMVTTGIAAGNAAGGPLTESHLHLGFTFAAAAAALGAGLGLRGARTAHG